MSLIDTQTPIERMLYLMCEVGFVTIENWENKSRKRIPDGFIRPLKKHYSSRLIDFLEDAYVTKIEFWKFNRVPSGVWGERKRCVEYLDWLGKKLSYLKQSDWYQVTAKDFQENFGSSLLAQQKSIADLLSDYLDFNFLPWRFAVAPNGFWGKKKNHRRFLDFVQ